MIVEIDDADRSEWDDFVRKSPNCRFFHLWSFRKSISDSYSNCIPKYYVIKKNNKITAAFPLFLVKSRILGNRFISLPFIDSADFIGEYSKKGLLELFSIISNKYSVKVEIRTNDLSENAKLLCKMRKPFLSEDKTRQQLIIHLKKENEMWDNFDKHTRNDIRKSEKSGLVLKKIDNQQELNKFYKLYLKNMSSFGTPQHSLKYFKMLLGQSEIFFGLNCYYQDSLAGSIIILHYKSSGYVAFNVSDPKYREFRPNDLLYWTSIKQMLSAGVNLLDLGQVDVNSSDQRAIGLYNFKKKWLGEIHQRTYFTFPYSKSIVSDRKSKLKKLRYVWRKLPLFIVKIIGPKICAQLGV